MKLDGWFSGKNKKKLPEDTGQAGNVSFPPIQGIDTVKGIAMTGGTAEGYRQVLSMFRRDAEERVQKFRFFLYEGMGSGKFPEKHLASFITQIHAIKSASATIGAAETSDRADRLESAAKNAELSFIHDSLPDFVEYLAELLKRIRIALESGTEKAGKPKSVKGDYSVYFPLLSKLAEALGSKNVIDADRILDELNKMPLDKNAKETLEQISDQILMTEFESAIKTIKEFMGSNK